jgi:hypothetical protein
MNNSERRRRVDELRELRKRFDSAAGADTPSVGVMQRALDNQIREALIAESGSLHVALDGRPVRDHTIDVQFLANVLGALQYAITSVGQSVVGEPTRRGVIPADIRRATALSVAATFAGSFGLHLTAAAPEQQTEMFEGERTVLERSISSVVEILSVAGGSDTERLHKLGAALGPRAFTGLQSLVQLLANGEVTASIEWRSPSSSVSTNLSPNQLAQARDSMATTEVITTDTVIIGRLVGASLVRSRFELETTNGVVFAGAVDPGVLDRIQRFFGDDCQAKLRVTTVRSLAEGSFSETYVLIDIG